MALKDLVSDLSNFNGRSQYDKLDSQIENGVDFFPNTDAPGFTPKTDLESLYHKVKEGTFAKEWPGAAPKNEKTRQAYGQQGEYKVGGMIGRAVPQFIFSGDNFGTPWSSDFPQFQSDFMTTPIANHISGYSPPSILSQTFTLSPPDLQKPDFSSWMTFSPIGDNVTQFASLLPLTGRTSQFSFPEADRQNNISINPEGFLGLQTTFDLPRESWRHSTTITNDTFQPTFSSLGLGSSEFTDQIDLFHRYESSDFTNLPGIGDDNLFFNRSLGEGGSFRKAADPVGLTHPIILRPFGSNWKTAYEDLQVPNWIFKSPELKFGNNLGFSGVNFGELASRNIVDEARILRWSITPEGASFVTKQYSLQKMNPTIETKQFNAKSILGVAGGLGETVLPIYHPERHVGGLLSRYENVLNLTGWNPEEGLQLTGGSRLAYQAAAFTIADDLIPDIKPVKGEGILSGLVNLGIGLLNEVADTAAASIAIGLSSPNKYSPWPSAAPISTRLGYVAFGIPTAQAIVDTLWVQNKPGGTFNKKTSHSGEEGDLKRHSTLNYEYLTKKSSYENSIGYGTGKRRTRDLGQQGMVVTSRMRQADSHQNQLNLHDQLGEIKGDYKSDNIDKINAIPVIDVTDDRINSVDDFIKFRFCDLVNDKYIIFRAILDGISDAVTPEYGEERYIGRPDKVYVYQGTDRTISFNFSIYPKTKQEFPILIEKMEYLIGLCYPTYTDQNFMKTPFISLTMGDMFNETPGILTGLTITVEDTTTWEIDPGLQFPHYIKAACEFKHIGMHELRTDGIHYDLPNDYRQTNKISSNKQGTTVQDDTLAGQP